MENWWYLWILPFRAYLFILWRPIIILFLIWRFFASPFFPRKSSFSQRSDTPVELIKIQYTYLVSTHFSVPIENVWVLKIIGLNRSIRPKISRTYVYYSIRICHREILRRISEFLIFDDLILWKNFNNILKVYIYRNFLVRVELFLQLLSNKKFESKK